MDDKSYTFQDWKAGKINADFEDGVIDEVKTRGLGNLVKKVYRAGYIPDKEYQQILNAQKKTFFKAVDITSDTLIRNFKEVLKESPDPNELLKEQKKLLRDYLDNAPNHFKRKVLKNKWDPNGIDYKVYRFVENMHDNAIIHLANPSQIPDEGLEGRTIKHFSGLVAMVADSIFPESDMPEDIRKFNLSEYVNNDFYHIAIYIKYLRGIEDIDDPRNTLNPGSSTYNNKTLPNPEIVAEQFQNQSKNKKTPYSKEEYSFVMKYARDNKEVKSVSKLIRDLKKLPDCPQKIKPEKKAKNSIRNWIKFYDKIADIKRN